ncbi:MAG: hypothetical protein GXO92_01315 [FCB group bacterium]|nr:hypothetical protein [FCB group bacterium]
MFIVKNKTIWFLFISITLLFIFSCRSNQVEKPIRIESMVDTTDATIGDIIHYRVTVSGGSDRPLKFSDWENDSLSFEIRNRRMFATERDRRGVEFAIVFWDTGHYEIPAYNVVVMKPDSSVDYVFATDPVEVNIHSILKGAVTPEIKPIKGPVPVKMPLPWKGILFAGLLVVLIAGIIWTWKKRIPPVHMEEESWEVTEPADTVALRKLRELDDKYRDDVKEFYVRLSHILRQYVESSLYIKTLEMTTEQIRANRELFPFEEELWGPWISLLERADLIKYAKHVPAPEMLNRDLNWSREFIRDTLKYWKPEQVQIPAGSEV